MIRTPLILILLAALTSCGNFQENAVPREVVRFQPGMTLREAVSPETADRLEREWAGSVTPYIYVIGEPHILQLILGEEVIELRPGGYNSGTGLVSGYFTDDQSPDDIPDDGRLGYAYSDTGEEISWRDARALAIRWCAQAERGLGVRSRFDPVDRFDNYMPSGMEIIHGAYGVRYEHTVVCNISTEGKAAPNQFGMAPSTSFSITLVATARGSGVADDVPDCILQLRYSRNIGRLPPKQR